MQVYPSVCPYACLPISSRRLFPRSLSPRAFKAKLPAGRLAANETRAEAATAIAVQISKLSFPSLPCLVLLPCGIQRG